MSTHHTAGHRVLVLDSKLVNPNRYLAVAVRHAFAAHPAVETAVLATYADAIDKARALRPTLLLVFGGEEIDHFILRKLIQLSAKSAIWYTEDPYELSRNLETAQLVDLAFSNDRHSTGRYGNGHYLPLAGFEPFHYRPVEPKRRRYDLFFAGTAWPNRVTMFEKLFALDPDLRLKLFVPPSPFGALDNDGGGNSSVQGIHVAGSDFARFCARSATTLYLTRDFSLSPDSPSLTTSAGPRFFETALAGGVQIYPSGTLDLPDGYVEGETAFAYTTLEDLVALVVRFRDDPALWAATAEHSQRVTLERHLYQHRVSTILSLL